MRVCHVIHDLRRGGAEHLLVDLAGAAAGADLEISVVGLMPTSGQEYAADLRRAGVDVRSLGLWSRWDPLAGRRLAALLADRPPHVLHTHLKHADLAGAGAARRLGIPMVSSLHVVEDAVGPLGRLKRGLAMRARDRAATRIVAVSSALRDWYLSVSDRDPESVIVLRNGVAAHPVASPEERLARRAALGVPPEAVMAATVVVLRPGKGVDELLAVAAAMPQEPDVRFVVAGSGPEEGRLRDEAARLGMLGTRVIFTGFVEDVAGLLATADLLVHPSHADALATAIIHGMAAGLPVVATDVGGTPELVGGGNGILVPPADPAGLREAILALAADPARRAAMGRSARERFAAEFDIDVWTARLAEIYREVAGSGH